MMNAPDVRRIFTTYDYTRVLMSFSEWREAVWCGLISQWRARNN
jgi:hypothetical protein